MNTLIVPCAGKSTRFPNLKPKWMLYYPDGKMMVEKCIEGLNLNEFDRVIFTIVKEHDIQFEAENILKEIFNEAMPGKYEILVLDEFTSCQAETVYLTLEKCNVKGKFSVKDSDNYIEMSVGNDENYISGVNINTFPKEIGRLSGKSFLILNSQDIVIDIIEKSIKSEYIGVGLYGFSNADVFREAYMHLRDVSDKQYEIYLSHIISYLIGTQKAVFKYKEVKKYEDWGTIKDWNEMLIAKKTIIINVDGIVFEKVEPYGNNSWKKGLKAIKQNVLLIQKKVNEGAQLILITSMPEQMRKVVEDELSRCGICYHELIMGGYLSQELVIKCRNHAVPYPDTYSVCIPEGEKIEDYVR